MRIDVSVLALMLAAPIAAQEHELVGVARLPDRAPAAEATVTIRWRTHPELPGLCGHTIGDDGVSARSVTTDNRGRFRVAVPVAGPFEILCASDAGKLASIRRFPVMAGGYLELALEPALWIGGTVRNEAAEPAPLAGFEIALEPFEQTWSRYRGCGAPIRRYRVTSDAKGRWRCNYPSGYLREAFWEPYLVPVAVDTTQWIDGGRLLMPDVACQKLELTVRPWEQQVGAIEDQDGKPIAGALVFDPLAPHAGVRTDDAGRFRIGVAKTHRMHAMADGYRVGKLRQPKVKVAKGEWRARLRPMPRGTVALHDADGRPLDNVPVLFSDRFHRSYPPLERTSRTDAQGAVTLSGEGLGMSSIGFALVEGRYVPFVPFPRPSDAVRQQTIAPRSINGTITDTDGVPLASARVTARSRRDDYAKHGDPLWVTYSDHGGRFRFASLPPGPLVLVAAAGAAGFAKSDVDGKAKNVALRTGDEEAIAIDVVDDDGKPCTNVWVTLSQIPGSDDDLVAASPSGGPTLVAFTDESGRVRFRGAPGLAWMAVAMRLVDGKPQASGFVPVLSATTTTLELAATKR